MNVVIAIIFGLAAAVLAEGVRRNVVERRVRQRALEQIGLRQPKRAEQSFKKIDRRTTIAIGSGVLCAIVGMAIVGVLGIAFAAAPILIDRTLTKRAQQKRTKALADALPGALQLLVDNLRVGRDLVSAMTEVSENSPEPVASIFSSVVSEVRLGARVDEAVAAVAALENDRHLTTVSSAIGLNVEFGGNLVEILSVVIESLEEEDRLRRDIESITADGRLSSTVLLVLPIITLIVVSVLSPGYAAPLIEEPMGQAMSVAGVILGVAGWAWLRSLSSTDVVA